LTRPTHVGEAHSQPHGKSEEALPALEIGGDSAPFMSADEIRFRVISYYIADMPLRDRHELMERPFFSLAKNKRMKPIDYTSPDGKVWVRVSPHAEHGMATIWDADVLIWAISQIVERKRRGEPIGQRLMFHPNELLRGIGRDYGSGMARGGQYEWLEGALTRLQGTTISSNIRTLRGNRERKEKGMFSWLNDWTYVTEEGEPKRIEITLSYALYRGVVRDGGVLAINHAYFRLTGGLERMLYRIARKHCGSQDSFKIRLDTLYSKTGSDEPLRNFRGRVSRMVARDRLPDYHVTYDHETDLVTFYPRIRSGDIEVMVDRTRYGDGRQAEIEFSTEES
jgi:plasmid replication initiation protein